MKCINEHCQREIGDVKFCPFCGTKQEKPKVFCVYCGAEMDEDAVFCNECGRKSYFVQQKELEEQERRAEERAEEEERKKKREEELKKEQIASQRKAAEQKALEERAEKEAEAQSEYADLMSELVPDLVTGRERLELHLFFVKKIASGAGWDPDEVASALTDFVSMYTEFESGHPGKPFPDIEKNLITHQAGMAHIGETVLDAIL
jgi:hypothetical protein